MCRWIPLRSVRSALMIAAVSTATVVALATLPQTAYPTDAQTSAPGFAINAAAPYTNTTAVTVGSYGAPPFGAPGVLVWDGGSIVRGPRLPDGTDFPSQATRLLPQPCISFNSGTSNATLAFMLADAATEVDARYDPLADANVCVILGGATDLALGRDPAAVLADLTAYCAGRRAAGYQVVVMTLPPRDKVGFNDARQVFDDLVRAHWPEFADGLVDVAADSRIGDPGDNHDTTYYQSDALHPNSAGNAVIAALTVPVLEGLTWRSDSFMQQFSDSADSWPGWSAYAALTTWTLPAGDGPKTVWAQYQDTVGNVVEASDDITLDSIAPTTTATGADGLWQAGVVTVEFAATDAPGGSGVAMTESRVDAGTWIEGGRCTVPAPPDHAGDGVHTVAYRSTDVAGNLEIERSLTVRIDTTAPTGSMLLNGTAATTIVPDVIANSAVSDLNGVTQMRFSTDGKTTWGLWLPYAATSPLTLLSGNGTKTVWAQYYDPAGNVYETSDEIVLGVPMPVPAPTVTGFLPTSGPVGTVVTLTGSDFSGATVLAFNGAAATSFTVDSATQITATVPLAATTGTIAVTTPGGTAASATSFTVTMPVFTPKVTLNLSGLTSGAMRLGKSVTAKGKVTPASLAGSKVKLTVQKKKGTRWVTLKSVTRTISLTGAYSWKYKPAKRGAYRMRATIAKSATHTAAKTKWRPFKVK